jgi:hypothetical protein
LANYIDVSTISYDVDLITENGTHYPLNSAILKLEWEEHKRELAQRATITIANAQIGNTRTRLASVAKINCIIRISARWNGSGKQLLLEGTIWEWHFVSATNTELMLIVYDPLIRLQQSKDFKYYSAGMTTRGIISDVCNDWNIPLSYTWGQSITHEKKVFNALRISDIIVSLLDEVHRQTKGDYIVQFRGGRLNVSGYGSNAAIYRFDEKCTISTNDKLTINDLVTRVKIIGVQDDEGRASVDAVVNGDTRFGVLQEIVRRDSNKTIEAARSEANTILEDRGKPEEITQINVPDLPFVRKGDRIEVAAGNLNGVFFVEGVTHVATTRRMVLVITRAANINTSSAPVITVGSSVGGEIKRGDIVNFKGGEHFHTSLDTTPVGGIRTPGRAWVQNIAPNGRQHYALIGGAYRPGVGGTSNVYGWVHRDLVEAIGG